MTINPTNNRILIQNITEDKSTNTKNITVQHTDKNNKTRIYSITYDTPQTERKLRASKTFNKAIAALIKLHLAYEKDAVNPKNLSIKFDEQGNLSILGELKMSQTQSAPKSTITLDEKGADLIQQPFKLGEIEISLAKKQLDPLKQQKKSLKAEEIKLNKEILEDYKSVLANNLYIEEIFLDNIKDQKYSASKISKEKGKIQELHQKEYEEIITAQESMNKLDLVQSQTDIYKTYNEALARTRQRLTMPSFANNEFIVKQLKLYEHVLSIAIVNIEDKILELQQIKLNQVNLNKQIVQQQAAVPSGAAASTIPPPPVPSIASKGDVELFLKIHPEFSGNRYKRGINRLLNDQIQSNSILKNILDFKIGSFFYKKTDTVNKLYTAIQKLESAIVDTDIQKVKEEINAAILKIREEARGEKKLDEKLIDPLTKLEKNLKKFNQSFVVNNKLNEFIHKTKNPENKVFEYFNANFDDNDHTHNIELYQKCIKLLSLHPYNKNENNVEGFQIKFLRRLLSLEADDAIKYKGLVRGLNQDIVMNFGSSYCIKLWLGTEKAPEKKV